MFDFNSGFGQISIDKTRNIKSGCITHSGANELNMLALGMFDAPMMFQSLMTHILKFLNSNICLEYIDGMLELQKALMSTYTSST